MQILLIAVKHKVYDVIDPMAVYGSDDISG
jgi:hypothetical protein